MLVGLVAAHNSLRWRRHVRATACACACARIPPADGASLGECGRTAPATEEPLVAAPAVERVPARQDANLVERRELGQADRASLLRGGIALHGHSLGLRVVAVGAVGAASGRVLPIAAELAPKHDLADAVELAGLEVQRG